MAGAFTTLQRAFRARDDTAALNTDGGWTDAQDTDFEVDVDTTFRVRYSIEETGGANGTIAAQLQYRYNDGGGWGSWINVTGTSSVIRAALSGQFADEDACSTQLLTGFGGTFDTSGLADELTGLCSSQTLSMSRAWENEFSLTIVSADVSDTDLIEIKVTDAGTDLDSYGTADTNIPQITVNVPAVGLLDQKVFRFQDNNANEATADWLAAQGIDVDVDDHKIFLVRFGIQETSAAAVSGFTPQLWGEKNATGGYGRLDETTDLRAYLSTVQTDDETVGSRLTGLTGTNVDGRLDEGDCEMTTGTNIPASGNAEFVFVLLLKRKLADNDFYDLRMRDGAGAVLNAYTDTPRVTMNRRAPELGYLEVKLSTATGGETTRAAGMANIADNAALDIIGEDMEIRLHVYTPTWNPGSTEGNQIFAAHYNSTGSQRAYRTQANESDTAGDIRLQVSETGAAVDVNDSPAIGGADAQEAQYRVVFEGDNGSSSHVTTTYSRTASIDADTLDDGGSWGAAKATVTTTPTIATIHPSTEQFAAFGSTFDNAGGYVGSKWYRLIVWEGFAASGRLAVDIRYYDRKYTAPEDSGDDSLWINQGEAPGIVTVVGTHVTGYDWVAAITPVEASAAQPVAVTADVQTQKDIDVPVTAPAGLSTDITVTVARAADVSADVAVTTDVQTTKDIEVPVTVPAAITADVVAEVITPTPVAQPLAVTTDVQTIKDIEVSAAQPVALSTDVAVLLTSDAAVSAPVGLSVDVVAQVVGAVETPIAAPVGIEASVVTAKDIDVATAQPVALTTDVTQELDSAANVSAGLAVATDVVTQVIVAGTQITQPLAVSTDVVGQRDAVVETNQEVTAVMESTARVVKQGSATAGIGASVSIVPAQEFAVGFSATVAVATDIVPTVEKVTPVAAPLGLSTSIVVAIDQVASISVGLGVGVSVGLFTPVTGQTDIEGIFDIDTYIEGVFDCETGVEGVFLIDTAVEGVTAGEESLEGSLNP